MTDREKENGFSPAALLRSRIEYHRDCADDVGLDSQDREFHRRFARRLTARLAKRKRRRRAAGELQTLEKRLELPVAALRLPAELTTMLEDYGLLNVGHLTALSRDELLALPWMGKVRMASVVAALARIGLQLRTPAAGEVAPEKAAPEKKPLAKGGTSKIRRPRLNSRFQAHKLQLAKAMADGLTARKAQQAVLSSASHWMADEVKRRLRVRLAEGIPAPVVAVETLGANPESLSFGRLVDWIESLRGSLRKGRPRG